MVATPSIWAQGKHVDDLESSLAKSQWVGGATPTQADVEALAVMNGKQCDPKRHPNVFAWMSIADKFAP